MLVCPATSSAQDMPKHEYYQYVPLTYLRPVRQAAGSEALSLYGDVANPSYRDVDPVDGVSATNRLLANR